MILILIAIISLIIICLVVLGLQPGAFIDFTCSFFVIIGFCMLIGYAFLTYNYIAAEYQANIINREYGTQYTSKEVFYASNVIETIRDLNRNRIELKGDLINKK